MAKLLLKGWRVGMNKIELNKLLQEHCGYGLLDAHQAVVQVLRGEGVLVEVQDNMTAELLLQAANSVGAECRIVECDDSQNWNENNS